LSFTVLPSLTIPAYLSSISSFLCAHETSLPEDFIPG
jgi:hypothetical protein